MITQGWITPQQHREMVESVERMTTIIAQLDDYAAACRSNGDTREAEQAEFAAGEWAVALEHLRMRVESVQP